MDKEIELQIQRIQLYFSQNRFKEAESFLLELLSQYPDLEYAQYMLAVAQTNQGKHQGAYELVVLLCENNAGKLEYLELKAEIEIASNRIEAAENTVSHLLVSNPENDDYFFLMARIKYSQRFYDKALENTKLSLALNPDNLGALNLSMTINSQLGNIEDARQSVKEALQRNPENPYTIANHGLSLLNEGKVNPALEKFKESLSLNPNNDIARYGMQEAMKSKFWPYKMLYKFGLLLGRLSGKNMWIFIVGSYIGFRFLSSYADNNPELQPYLNPLIFGIAVLFLSTWVLDPIMNVYLLSNKYGRFLLSKKDKQTAQYSAIMLLFSIGFGIAFLFTKLEFYFLAMIFFFAMLIPLGTMYKPLSQKNQGFLAKTTVAIFITGIIGLFTILLTNNAFIFYMAGLGIFAYQWVINGIMIKEAGRKF